MTCPASIIRLSRTSDDESRINDEQNLMPSEVQKAPF